MCPTGAPATSKKSGWRKRVERKDEVICWARQSSPWACLAYLYYFSVLFPSSRLFVHPNELRRRTCVNFWQWIHWLHYEMMHHFVLSAKSLLGKSWRKSRFKHISKWPIRSGHGRCYLCHYSRNEFALISFASNAWFSRGVKLIQSQNLELYSNSSGVSVARMIETHSICNAKGFKGDPLSAKDTSINCEKFECILRANRHRISILRKMKQ